MQLAYAPLVLILVGLIAYTVLAGADFGTGAWELLARRGPRALALRDFAHDAMGPVWEANHVWLVFVLTVYWSAYPTAFGSIMSTLSVPFFVAVVGIILRGSAYALRSGAGTRRERGLIDDVFALSSVLTPFALGAAVGGIASGRVPVGNAAGNLVTSWLNPTSAMIGGRGALSGRLPGGGRDPGRGARAGARVPDQGPAVRRRRRCARPGRAGSGAWRR